MSQTLATANNNLSGERARRRLRDRATPWLLLFPALAILAVFVLIPVGLSFIASLYEIPLTGLDWQYVGLENYQEAFGDPQIRRSLWNTFLYSLMTIVPSIILGLALALLVDSFTRGRTILRTLLFLPVTSSLVAMAIVFQWIFGVRGGFFNALLGLVGLGPINFLGNESTALPVIAAVGIWRYAAYNMVIYLAGLTAIPTSIREAVALDGIRGFARVRYIIWPLLAPSTVFVTVITIIQSIQVFETVSVMTQGGPLGATETLLFSIWREGFAFFRLGYAAALSTILLLLTVLFGLWRRGRITTGSR